MGTENRPSLVGRHNPRVGDHAAMRTGFEAPAPEDGSRNEGKAIEVVTDKPASHPAEDKGQDRILRSLGKYCELPVGWDGDGSLPAPKEAARDAERFLRMRPDHIPLPYHSISYDGVIGLFWKSENGYADASFEGDGKYYYYAVHRPPRGDVKKSMREDCPAGKRWPAGLVGMLGTILQPGPGEREEQ